MAGSSEAEAGWALERIEGRLAQAGITPAGAAMQAWPALKAGGLTEAQATLLWYFVCGLIEDHAEVVREECLGAIRALGGISGRN